MSEAKLALLPDRGVVSVSGADAEKFLQGLLTNDLDRLSEAPAVHAGLLSPQGKILFEFFVSQGEHGYLLEVAWDRAADLAKRLALYKLRANVEIRDLDGDLLVVAAWGDVPRLPAESVYPDPRAPELGLRALLPAGGPAAHAQWTATAAAYHARRIALGIPEGGRDYDFGDAFPHEADFDLLHGVAFDKGCYVGQEVVARMHHKTVVRKRVVRVAAAAELPAGRPDVTAGDVVIGRLGSVSGREGLAMLRLDRVIEFQDKGVPVTAAGVALDVDREALDRYARSAAERAGAP